MDKRLEEIIIAMARVIADQTRLGVLVTAADRDECLRSTAMLGTILHCKIDEYFNHHRVV